MSKDMYRSANGKTVDMGALRLKNEKTRAVGNMKVNSRGDVINDKNQVIQSRNQQVGKHYKQQTQPSAPKGKK